VSPPPEATAATTLLSELDLHVLEANPRGYETRHKKGKPLPRGPLIKAMVAQSKHKIGLVGPDYVGITTVLRKLE
jgi:hypothetical protein